MATIYKTPNKRWIAAIRRKNSPSISKVFDKHSDAKKWALIEEQKLLDKKLLTTKKSFHELLAKFSTEIAPSYKSKKTTLWMLGFIKKNTPNFILSEISSTDICGYRDKRLNSGVSGSSINKELNILSRVFDIAIKEWQWMDAPNPIKQVTRPKNGKHRQRRPTPKELLRLHEECLRSGNLSVWRMIELAIETGMRQGELLSLTQDAIDLKSRVAHLTDTKNGDDRDVPLSQKACKLFSDQIDDKQSDRIFSNWRSGDGFRSTYRRICIRANIDDLRFHDLRHEAASRLFEKGLNQFQVAAITGHRSLQSLQRYTHLKANDLVKLLD